MKILKYKDLKTALKNSSYRYILKCIPQLTGLENMLAVKLENEPAKLALYLAISS